VVRKLINFVIFVVLPLSCWAGDAGTGAGIGAGVEAAVSPVWSNLRTIFEYGGMPAVIMLFGWLYLRSVNSKWAALIGNMQQQFVQQQQMLLTVVQNNTAMLSTLSTKLGVGCMLFQRTAEQMSADREAERRAVEVTVDLKKAAGGFEAGEINGKKE
jgi:hypothetical protein